MELPKVKIQVLMFNHSFGFIISWFARTNFEFDLVEAELVHLPFDRNQTAADFRLEEVRDVHVGGVAGQVCQVDRPVGVLC